jgi:hypothetical protein
MDNKIEKKFRLFLRNHQKAKSYAQYHIERPVDIVRTTSNINKDNPTTILIKIKRILFNE